MKALIISSNLNIGGAQRFIVNFANDLLADYEIKVLTIQKGATQGFLGELNKNIKFECLESRALLSVFDLRRQILDFKPDVIFSTQSYVNDVVILAKLFSGIKSKLVIREASIISTYRNPVYWFSKILYRFADRIVAQTSNIKKSIKRHYGVKPEKIEVIPNYIDNNLLEKKALNGLVKIATEKRFVFLFCGRLHKVKNVDFLMNALSEVYKSIPEFEFWILGDGEERNHLEKIKRDKNLDFVKFLGFQENPYPYMKKADCILLSSEREGFPNVIVEAMSLESVAIINNFRGGASFDILTSDLKEFIYEDSPRLNYLAEKVLKMNNKKLKILKAKFTQESKKFDKENLLKKYIL